MTFAPLNKMRYSERIAKTIQMRILNGQLGYDERLPAEIVLAAEFDVSRSVVREAMRILDGLGLIKIKKGPKGGIFVSDGYHKPLIDSVFVRWCYFSQNRLNNTNNLFTFLWI